MLNLATEKDKRNLRKEYSMRLITVALFVFFVVSSLGALFLLPSFIVLKVRSADLGEELAQLQQSIESEGGNDARDYLFETNRKTSLVASIQKMLPSDEVLLEVLDQQNNGIHIRSITFGEKSAKGAATVSIKGEAETRTALVAFRDALEGEDRFGEVALPLKDLASNSEIPFSLTVTVLE